MKKYLLIGLLVSFCSSRIVAMKPIDEWDTKTRTAAALASSACLLGVGSLIAKSDATKVVAPWCNMSAKDLGAVVGVTTALGAASLFCERDMSRALRSWAFQVPCLALSSAVMQSRSFNLLLKHVPVLGKYVACQNKGCNGICEECKCRKGIVQVFTWSTLVQPLLLDLFGKKN